MLHGISKVFSFSPSLLGWLVAAIFGYALLLLVESFGLWSGRRWGEYFSVVATSVFLPWEIYRPHREAHLVRVSLLLINIAAVAWLVWSKRLFGVRGGGRPTAGCTAPKACWRWSSRRVVGYEQARNSDTDAHQIGS